MGARRHGVGGQRWGRYRFSPDPGTVMGLAFFGATPEEAEREAKASLGLAEPGN